MARVQCPTCLGIYADVDRQGIRYFHACPPRSIVELRAARARGDLVLSRRDQARLDAATAADVADPPAPGAVSRVDQTLGSLKVRRANHRDENQADTPPPIPAPPDDDDPPSRVGRP